MSSVSQSSNSPKSLHPLRTTPPSEQAPTAAADHAVTAAPRRCVFSSAAPQNFTVAEQVIGAYRVVNRGALQANHPAFAQLHGRGTQANLAVTGFEIFGPDTTTLYPHVHTFLGHPNAPGEVLTKDQPWPNEAHHIDAKVLGRAGWLVANGFLVPGKGDGAITFVDEVTRVATRLTKKDDGFFYHRVRAVHWGPNKSLALLTARAKKPMLGATQAELVLLTPQRHAGGRITCHEQVLARGPDVFFEVEDFDGDGVEELICAQFFGKKLELMWWENGSLHRRELDPQVGTAFDVTLANLAGTAQRALVLTTHEGGQRGGVYAYEIPKDFKHAPWTKHTLLANVATRGGFMGAASPGSPVVFYPGKQRGKPWIFVSGDDSQRGHLLVPNSENPSDWTYREHIVLDSKSTIGRAAVGDVDGDGSPELFIPVHDANAVAVLSVVPKSSS